MDWKICINSPSNKYQTHVPNITRNSSSEEWQFDTSLWNKSYLEATFTQKLSITKKIISSHMQMMILLRAVHLIDLESSRHKMCVDHDAVEINLTANRSWQSIENMSDGVDQGRKHDFRFNHLKRNHPSDYTESMGLPFPKNYIEKFKKKKKSNMEFKKRITIIFFAISPSPN